MDSLNLWLKFYQGVGVSSPVESCPWTPSEAAGQGFRTLPYGLHLRRGAAGPKKPWMSGMSMKIWANLGPPTRCFVWGQWHNGKSKWCSMIYRRWLNWGDRENMWIWPKSGPAEKHSFWTTAWSVINRDEPCATASGGFPMTDFPWKAISFRYLFPLTKPKIFTMYCIAEVWPMKTDRKNNVGKQLTRKINKRHTHNTQYTIHTYIYIYTYIYISIYIYIYT